MNVAAHSPQPVSTGEPVGDLIAHALAEIGVTGGFSELVGKLSRGSVRFDWRGWFAIGWWMGWRSGCARRGCCILRWRR